MFMRMLLLAVAAAAITAGCNTMPDNPGDTYKPPTSQTFDDQIAKVNADPNLTEAQKQQAIRGIEMGRAMSQGGGKSSGKPK